jgi:hypothetical protein
MTRTAIQVLAEAAERGLKLGPKPPDTLTVEPAERCPKDFVPVLKAHKPALLALLKWPFVMVDSQILDETIFFCEDEYTIAALVEAGAEPWSIYTRSELEILVAENRIAPFGAPELRKVHQIKRTFGGGIMQNDFE